MPVVCIQYARMAGFQAASGSFFSFTRYMAGRLITVTKPFIMTFAKKMDQITAFGSAKANATQQKIRLSIGMLTALLMSTRAH